jgi:hypothetical protein
MRAHIVRERVIETSLFDDSKDILCVYAAVIAASGEDEWFNGNILCKYSATHLML